MYSIRIGVILEAETAKKTRTAQALVTVLRLIKTPDSPVHRAPYESESKPKVRLR